MPRRYRPHGEGSATGAEEHALALESAWSRNAYGARHTEDLYEVMRNVENRLGTITSLRWTEDGAWVLLRTSRTCFLVKQPARTADVPGLCYVGSLVSRGFGRIRATILHLADLLETDLNIALSGKLA